MQNKLIKTNNQNAKKKKASDMTLANMTNNPQ